MKDTIKTYTSEFSMTRDVYTMIANDYLVVSYTKDSCGIYTVVFRQQKA